MTDQETYDRTLDAPATPAPAMPLPNEDYYRRAPQPQHGRRAGLGLALVVVGLVLLAFQALGRGFVFGGGGSYTLVDQQIRGNRLELSAAASDVEVRAWNGSEIKIVAIQRGGSRGDYQVDVSNSGDTVRVSESNRSVFCFFCSRDITYRIDMPQSAQVDIKTTSGEVMVDGLTGPVALTTVSGDIRAEDLQGGLNASTTSGEVHLSGVAGALTVGTISGDVGLENGKVDGATISTTSGEVDLDGASGQLHVETVSGDVTVRDANDAQLNVSTTSGEVEYQGELAGGASQVNTISGDVKLQLPENSSFRLDASSVSGEVSSDFNLGEAETGRNSLKGIVGGGAATLTIGTTSGEINVEAR